MGDQGIGSEDTVAAPSEQPAKHATTKRESDPIVPRPAGSVTRASSPSLRVGPTPDDYPDLLPVDPAHYKVVREIARGGMGRILEVRDRRLGRNVAIKEVIHADESGLARFEREVAITARLQHPAIVHVHEAGRWPDGKPFYVMKLIRGKPLDARIAVAKSLAERLELLAAVITVVDALAYAHSQQVIHRDLKPANVLVGDFGETIVIDWGIAKAFDDTYDPISIDPDRAPTTETIAGSVIGTPSYMPPEQAAGERVDARADVYSLGAMLYQVLAGKPPFVGRTTAEVLAKVLDEKPPALAELDPDIPADLIAIVEKAMAREPADRFPTANEMAIELKRFQQGKLIASRQYTKWELAKRWLYRYRAPVAVAVIAMAALAVATVIYVIEVTEESERADAEARRRTIEADEGHLGLAREKLDRDPTDALAVLEQLSTGSEKWRAARTIAADAASRGVSQELTTESGSAIWLMQFSPDGRLLADHGDTGNLRVWDLEKRTSELFYPAGKLFAFAFENNDTLIGLDFQNTVWRWKRGQPQGTRVRTLAGEINTAVISPDGKRIAVFGYTMNTQVVEIATGDVRTLDRRYHKGSWTLDGKTLLLVDRHNDGRVVALDIASGDVTDLGSHGGTAHVAGQDRSKVWIAAYNASQRSSLLRLGNVQVSIPNSENGVITSVFALASGWFAASGRPFAETNDTLGSERKGTLLKIDPVKLVTSKPSVWLFPSIRAEPIALLGHKAHVTTVTSTPDGKLATADERGAIRIWRVPAISQVRTTAGAVNGAFLTEDRRRLVVSRRGPRFEVHDLFAGTSRTLELQDLEATRYEHSVVRTQWEDRAIIETIDGYSEEVLDIAKPTRGSKFATLDVKERVALWDIDRGSGKIIVEGATHVAISPDGKVVATVTSGHLHLWDTASGTLAVTFRGIRPVSALAIGNDRRVLIAFQHRAVMILEPGRPEKLLVKVPHVTRVAALSPDGNTAIVAGDDAVLRVFDGGAPRLLEGHRGTVLALQFSADGRFVASAAADKDVRVWSVASGEVVRCPGHTAFAATLDFYGESVVSSGFDRTARVCDAVTGTSRALIGAGAQVIFAAHVAGGSRVVVVDRFGGIIEHADNLPAGEPLLRAWLDAATNLVK